MSYMWNLKNKMNECNKNRLTNIENKLVVTNGGEGKGGARWGRELRDTNYYV